MYVKYLTLGFFIGVLSSVFFVRNYYAKAYDVTPLKELTEKKDSLAYTISKDSTKITTLKEVSDSLKIKIDPVSETTDSSSVDSSFFNSEIRNAKKIEARGVIQDTLIKMQSKQISDLNALLGVERAICSNTIAEIKEDNSKQIKRAFFRGVGVGACVVLIIFIL